MKHYRLIQSSKLWRNLHIVTQFIAKDAKEIDDVDDSNNDDNDDSDDNDVMNMMMWEWEETTQKKPYMPSLYR